MKLKTISFLLTLLFFCSCSNTRRITELQNQITGLEKDLSVRKHENMEWRSFRASLEEQLKKSPCDYIKICQTNDTATIETLFIRYNQLLQNYNQLQTSYKSLKDKTVADKMSSEKTILELRNKSVSSQKTNKKHP